MDRIRAGTLVDVAVPGPQAVDTRGTSCALAGTGNSLPGAIDSLYFAMGTYYRRTDVES
jgi:hypothetical protein